MTLDELFADLSQRRVQLWADGDQLQLRAPKGTLTPQLRAVLTERKPEILALLRRSRVADQAAFLPLTPVPRDGKLPLSFAQQRLWFLAQMYPDSVAYNLPNAFHLTGPLNSAALEQSLQRIVQRHEILRTTFQNVDGQAVQITSSDLALAVPLAVVDLRAVPAAEREAQTQQLIQTEAHKPFDLNQGPLLRVQLLRLAEEEHLFLLTLHHIVSDGWSSMIFLRELKAYYEELSVGTPAQLPDLSIQYADYASWERRWLQGEVVEAQLAYWKHKLDGRLPVLELPADHPRLAVKTYLGECHSFSLSKTLLAALKELSQRAGVTLFMTLLAALKTLLYRYTGQTDILIGSPIAHRSRSEIENLIGCFINTLVFRTDVSGNPRFQELLGRVRQTCAEAYAHQDLPFEKLVEELQPERDLSHSPVFQVMLILHVQDTRKVSELANLTLTPREIHSQSAKFDITLELHETSEGLQGWFEYSTDLFDTATVARLQGHFQVLLKAIVANPETPLANLPLLTDVERYQLLTAWNTTQREFSQDKCVHQLFEAQVERTPDTVAVVCEEQQLTYQQLNWRANQLAYHLQALGVGPAVCVGICVERSLEMLVGLLGVLKAGGAYVPLDPTYPSERLAFVVADSHIPVLLTHHHLLPNLPPHQARVVCLDTDRPELSQANQDNPANGATPDHPAYVIYTSGSTGVPKGVQVLHQGVVNFLEAMAHKPGLSADDSLLAVTTLSFDIAVLELLLPLVVGARVVIASRDVAADGGQLGDTLATVGATVMQATPATWRLLIAAGWEGGASLRILCGGEVLPSELAEQLWTTGGEVWNLYGPTETTIWSAAHHLADPQLVPIGQPIANTQFYILDSYLQPVPVGVPGELHIGGTGLAQGYLNRPQLTAEKFIVDPFSTRPGARLYKTGDLVRYRSDGSLEFLGRLDHQVKVRGFRIELGEIETVLGQQPAVREAVVVAREMAAGDKRLVAYVVPDRATTLDLSTLRRSLRNHLPEYMLPAAFVLLDTFPLTPNGKVDRHALPAPEQTRPVLEDAFVAPRNRTEESLAEIWGAVIGVASVGVRDNFFALGGHSLLAIQMLSRVRDAFDIEIPVPTFFAHPTVAGLAEALGQQQLDQVGEAELARLLAEVEELSLDETQVQLRDS